MGTGSPTPPDETATQQYQKLSAGYAKGPQSDGTQPSGPGAYAMATPGSAAQESLINQYSKGVPGAPNADERLATQRDANAQQAFDSQHMMQTGTGLVLKESDFTPDTLSSTEFSALPEKQQRAVEFNTALVRATTADKSAVQPTTQAQIDSYNESYQRVFGEAPDAKTEFAPNTVALLDSLGVKPRAQLDDFLNLHSAIQDTDLSSVTDRSWVFDSKPDSASLAVRPSEAVQFTDATDKLKSRFDSGALWDSAAGSTNYNTKRLGDLSFQQQIQQYIKGNLGSMGIGSTQRALNQDTAAAISAVTGISGSGAPTQASDFEAVFQNLMTNPAASGTSYDQIIASMQNNGYDPAAFFEYADNQYPGFSGMVKAGSLPKAVPGG
jgi:hypothetical protein